MTRARPCARSIRYDHVNDDLGVPSRGNKVSHDWKEHMMGADDRGPKILFGVLVLIVLIGMLFGGTMMGPVITMGPGMMWGVVSADARPVAGGWAWGFVMAFGMLMMLAFWAALILGAVLLVRWAIGRPSQGMGQPRPEDPREILRRRYAAGEIDQAAYQHMKHELEDDAGIVPRHPVGADRIGS